MRPIEVRPIEPADMPGVVELCLTARRESWAGAQVCTADAAAVAHQVGTLTAVPGGTILVALADGLPIGLLLGRVVGPNPFTDDVSLAVEAVYVDPEHRRRGAGHALMLGAVDVALSAGAQHVYAAPIPGARGMQRFFVQLGFAPAAAHRVTSTAALQRRLSPDSGPRRAPRGLEDLIARRRQSRAETAFAVEPGAQAGPRMSISTQVKRAVQIRRDVESSTTTS